MTSLATPSATTAGPPAGPGQATASFRYPGSPPFQDTDLDRQLFKGRRHEAALVFHTILSADLLVLYARSGMGKTSLLNAGVMHELRARGYWPVSVRLNKPEQDPVVQIREQIEHADQKDDSVEVVHAPGASDRIDHSLWDLIASLEVWRGNDLQEIALVFDQFEELFKLDWSPGTRERFICDLGHILRGFRPAQAEPEQKDGADSSALRRRPRARFVIVIREDSLGELEALSDHIPQILDNRFRLGPLDVEQATAAIREPAQEQDARLDSQPFEYTPAAAAEILGFLRSKPKGMGADRRDDAIDPSQLQLVCQYVEREILPSKEAPPPGEITEIDAPDLGGVEGLERILTAFYRRVIDSFPESERDAVRELCEPPGLINHRGLRLSLERGEILDRFGVSAAQLDQLVDLRLLRAEPRVNSVYYELAHDTLVEPILADRNRRLEGARRRRRSLLWAGAALLALVVVGALFWLISRGGSDDVAGSPALPLNGVLVGQAVVDGDQSASFRIASPGTALITVRPTSSAGPEDAGTDVAVAITNAAGRTRRQDQFGPGQPERLVVPSGTEGEVDVTFVDAPTGEFEIGVGELAEGDDVQRLDLTDEATAYTSGVEIDEAGGLRVFGLDVEGAAPVAIVVSPTEALGKPLDAMIEVIDPTGAELRRDANGSGEPEIVVPAGVVGHYDIVVRGYDTSVGAFEIAAQTLAGSELTGAAGEEGTLEGEISQAGGLRVFAIDSEETSDVEVEVTPTGTGELDLHLDVFSSEGFSWVYSNGDEGTVEPIVVSGGTPPPSGTPDSGTASRHVLVRGVGSSTGGFEIAAHELAEGPGLEVGESHRSTVDLVDSAPSFSFTPPDDATYLWTVTPTDSGSGFDPVVEVLVADRAVSVVDSGAAGSGELAAFEREVDTTLRITGWDGSLGDFEVRVVEATRVDVGDTTTTETGSIDAAGELRAYQYVTEGDTAAAVTADPQGDLDVAIEVPSPDGPVDESDSLGPSGDETVTTTRPGAHVVVVRGNEGSTGGYTLGFETRQIQPLDVGASATGERFGVYDIEISAGQPAELRAHTDNATIDVEIESDGGATVPVVGSGEEPAAALLREGSYRVEVIVEEGADFTVSLTAVSRERLEPGRTDGQGNSVYELGIGDGQVVALRAEAPSRDSEIAVAVYDADGYEIDYARGDGPDARTMLLNSGTYQVTVVTDAQFTIAVTPVEVQPLNLDGTAPVTGAIDLSGQVRVYELTTTGATAVVRADPEAALDAVLEVTSAAGYAIGYSDGFDAADTERVDINTGADTYRIIVRGFQGTTGPYTLTIGAV